MTFALCTRWSDRDRPRRSLQDGSALCNCGWPCPPSRNPTCRPGRGARSPPRYRPALVDVDIDEAMTHREAVLDDRTPDRSAASGNRDQHRLAGPRDDRERGVRHNAAPQAGAARRWQGFEPSLAVRSVKAELNHETENPVSVARGLCTTRSRNAVHLATLGARR